MTNLQSVPYYGGILKEGIVATNSSDIQSSIDKLTKIGLVGFDKDKNIVGAIAQSWQISDDQKTYTFILSSKFNSTEIAQIYKKEKTDWTDIEVNSLDDKTLVFVLKQPFSPFLANLIEPILPYGPYKLFSQNNNQIKLVANTDFFASKPYITNIEINIYPNSENLQKAIRSNQINFAADSTGISLPEKWNEYTMQLPRYIELFFNLKRDVVQDPKIRQKLARGEKLDNNIKLTLVTSDNEKYLALADEIKTKWQEFGVDIEIQAKTNKELQQEVIPTRNYDILLYGLDFGYDPDPYPFWHSSQLSNTGLNLSNFSDVNADKLLEDARMTNDPNIRKQKYDAFNKILLDQVPAIQIEQITTKFAASNKINGLINHGGFHSTDRYFEIWKWFINSKKVSK
jgi:ABC-type transport system substrate-binding protein